MDSFTDFIKSAIFWLFFTGMCSGLYIGFNAGSYLSLEKARDNALEITTPEYRYKYRNNIFYVLNRWLDPDKFKDVRTFEIRDVQIESEKTIEALKNEKTVKNDS